MELVHSSVQLADVRLEQFSHRGCIAALVSKHLFKYCVALSIEICFTESLTFDHQNRLDRLLEQQSEVEPMAGSLHLLVSLV